MRGVTMADAFTGLKGNHPFADPPSDVGAQGAGDHISNVPDTDLPLWVVYDHPTDYPDHYVARQHLVGPEGQKPTDRMMAHPELGPIRVALENMGLICVVRNPEDDPVIVETWL